MKGKIIGEVYKNKNENDILLVAGWYPIGRIWTNVVIDVLVFYIMTLWFWNHSYMNMPFTTIAS